MPVFFFTPPQQTRPQAADDEATPLVEAIGSPAALVGERALVEAADSPTALVDGTTPSPPPPPIHHANITLNIFTLMILL